MKAISKPLFSFFIQTFKNPKKVHKQRVKEKELSGIARLAQSSNQMGFDRLRKFAGEQKNFVFSPLANSFSLAMAINGNSKEDNKTDGKLQKKS